MIAEKTALPVALPFWGGFRRILAVTGGRNANEFAVSGLFGGACLGLQNPYPLFKSGRRLQTSLRNQRLTDRRDVDRRVTVPKLCPSFVVPGRVRVQTDDTRLEIHVAPLERKHLAWNPPYA
jgi:hypothetical protein